MNFYEGHPLKAFMRDTHSFRRLLSVFYAGHPLNSNSFREAFVGLSLLFLYQAIAKHRPRSLSYYPLFTTPQLPHKYC